MTTTDEQDVPGPNSARHSYAMHRHTAFGGPTITEATTEVGRFLASVRRDAAREALDGLAADKEQFSRAEDRSGVTSRDC